MKQLTEVPNQHHGLHARFPLLDVPFSASSKSQDHGKRGVEFKGGSLHDGFGGFDGFGGSGKHLALLLLLLQNTVPRGSRDGFDGFGGFGGCGGFGRDGYPP